MSKITKSCRGKECQIRHPSFCNKNDETTVPCHLNGYGMGTKHSDLFLSDGCTGCHSFVDAHPKIVTSIDSLPLDIQAFIVHAQGIFRTQQRLLDEGLIKIVGSKK